MPVWLAMTTTEATWLLALVLLVSAGGVAYAAYYGLQSLRQARLLNDTVPFSRLAANVGRRVALTGRPELVQAHSDPFKSRCLWIKTSYQSFHSGWGGGRRGWRTVRVDREGFDFTLQEGEASVLVRADQATEVHGTEGDSAGWSFVFGGGGSGDHRTLRRHLPVAPRLTVCGRLVQDGQGYAVVADDEVGLLLSPSPSGAQARTESLKGWLGVAVLPVAWAVGLLAWVGRLL